MFFRRAVTHHVKSPRKHVLFMQIVSPPSISSRWRPHHHGSLPKIVGEKVTVRDCRYLLQGALRLHLSEQHPVSFWFPHFSYFKFFVSILYLSKKPYLKPISNAKTTWCVPSLFLSLETKYQDNSAMKLWSIVCWLIVVAAAVSARLAPSRFSGQSIVWPRRTTTCTKEMARTNEAIQQPKQPRALHLRPAS